jgi:hypothetical protein
VSRRFRTDLAERSEWYAFVPKVTGSIPRGGSESIFRSDLLLSVRGSRMYEPSLWLHVCCVTRVTHSSLSI